MMRSLFSGVSGLKSHQTAMDVIGNNIANVNSTAFKANRVVFCDLVRQTISEASAPTDNNGGQNAKQVGLGASISAIAQDMTEGSSQHTDAPLDFKISGEGYFVVQGVDGYLYTRNGNFALDAQGYLVTQSGEYVMGVVSNIANDIADDTDTKSLNADLNDNTRQLKKIQMLGTVPVAGGGTETYLDYAVDSYGKITVTDEAGDIQTIGRLALAVFNNTAGLEALGNSKYFQTANSGDPEYRFVNDHCGNINSGQLEMSNVSLATELTNMIIVQRGFQANSRVITTSDTLLEELVNLKR
ncbi:MAG: flagellar hook-basal body complex protein [Ruminococcaceae bacterium]|nr:flagellar hook-basal body complex protein [Oscillospiraceae bacterium]